MNGTLTSTSQAGKALPPSPTLSSALSLSQTLGLSSVSSGANEADFGLYSSATLDADPNAPASSFDLGSSFGLGMDDFASPLPAPPDAPSSNLDIMYGASTAGKGKAKANVVMPTTSSAAASSSRIMNSMNSMTAATATAAAAAPPSAASSASLPIKTNPFLNKLRSMVDDPKTDELIRWSSSGETFVVPNNIRFGDEVLPRFFKHNRFTSFVRQLNMYGFHKVPSVQAGALKHDTPQEAELWEFRNPHFQRARPDLMAFVARRKNNEGAAAAAAAATTTTTTDGKVKGKAKGKGKADSTMEEASLNPINGALTRNSDNNEAGALQLASVWQAIQSIQSAQKGINDNLRHLHNTNIELRREALEQRQRSKKQQDTINKMLRFLAGVFGAQDAGVEQGSARAGSPSSRAAATSRTGAPTTARRRMTTLPSAPRLRISDGTTTKERDGAIVHDEELNMLQSIVDDDQDSSMRFIEEAISNTGSPSSQQANSPPCSSTSRFVNLPASPPLSERHAELPYVSETASTPGGGRRLSQQAGKQIIEALSSTQGSDWLASLFGGETLGAAGASTPGGGFKLDQSTLGALQSVLNSAATAGSATAAGGASTSNDNATSAQWNQNYFSPTVATEEDEAARFSEWTNGADVDSIETKTAAAYKSKWNDSLTSTPSRQSKSSTALVQSPGPSSMLNFGTAPSPANGTSDTAATATGGGIPVLTSSQQAQLALTLQRASQSLHGATGDAATVQSAINVLIDGMRQDPALAVAQHAMPDSATSNEASHYADASMYDVSSGGVGGSTEPLTDVDMDSLLREFLNAGGAASDTLPSTQQSKIEEASCTSSGRGTGTANSPIATTGDSAGSSPSAYTTAPTFVLTPSTLASSSSRPARKRAPPPEFEGVLGADIEMANAKARRRRIGEDA